MTVVERWVGDGGGETLARHRANVCMLELAGAGRGRGQGAVSEGIEVEVRDLDGGPPASSCGWGSTTRQES